MKNHTNTQRRLLDTYRRYVRKWNRLKANEFKNGITKKLNWLKKRINHLRAQLIFLQDHANMISRAALVTGGLFFLPQLAKTQTFELKTSHPFIDIIGNNTGAISFVDFDSDSDMDFFIWGDDIQSFQYYENTGSDYSEKQLNSIPSGFGFTELLDTSSFVNFHGSLTDFDADGDLDLFVGASPGAINYLRNDDNVYSPVIGAESPFDTTTFADNTKPNFGDLDGDGDIDAVIASSAGVHIYINNEGFFDQGEMLSESLDEASTLLYDFDNDGDLDLLVGNKFDDLTYFNNNEGVLTAGEMPLTGIEYKGYSDMAFTDVDFDGDMEFVLGDADGAMNVFEDKGGLDFEYLAYNPLDIKTQGNYSSPVFIDFDNDGDDDLFIGLSGDIVYYENVDGKYEASDQNPFSGLLDDFSYLKPTFEDYDSDGDMDLLIGEYEGIQVFNMNDGVYEMITDTLQNPFHNITEANHQAPAFYDADGDGDLDLVLGNKNGGLEYFVNNDGVYEAATTNIFGDLNVSSYSDPVFIDLDADGDQDLVVGMSDDIKFFINNDGTFTETSEAPIQGSALFGNIAPGFLDYNKDGSLDILLGSTLTNRILFFENKSGAVSVKSLVDQNDLTEIFPNPVADILNLKANWLEGDGEIYIFDSQGKIINSQKVTGINHQINIAHFPIGHYILQITDGKGNATKNFIVSK